MITKFRNREQELAALRRKWRERGFQFIPIYGRRRVGKTELILQFIKRKPAIYFLASAGTKKENIERFKLAARATVDLSLIKDDWHDILAYIAHYVKKRLIIVIDEFPYLIETEQGLASIFQAAIDTELKRSNIFLILCGSSLSMMWREVLAYRAPLYGRRTGQLQLRPLSFRDVTKFFNKPIEEIIKIYSVCGGIPAYLNEFLEPKPLLQLIVKKILAKDAVLKEEVAFLLRQEFRDPKVYMAILSAIALGNRNLGRIINYCGFESKAGIMPYLRALEALGYVKREVPVTERERAKKGLYFITDRFFDFWFRFVRPLSSLLEQDPQAAAREIERSFDQHTGSVFEEVCRELLWALRAQHKIFGFNKIGRWWRKDTEIDIIALNQESKDILFAECKWGDRVDAAKVLAELKAKAALVDWRRGKRTEHFAIFAKSFRRRAPGVLLLDLKDIGRAARARP